MSGAAQHWPRRGGGTRGRTHRVALKSQPVPEYDDEEGLPLFQDDRGDDSGHRRSDLVNSQRDGGGSVASGGSSGGGGGSKHSRTRGAADPTRAPKLAVFLFLVFLCYTSVVRMLGEDSEMETSMDNNRSASVKVIDEDEDDGEGGGKKKSGDVDDKETSGRSGDAGGRNSISSATGAAGASDAGGAEPNIPGVSSSISKNMKFKLPRVDIRSPEMEHYADITESLLDTDIAVFWHVPRSGGSSIKDIYAQCLGLTMASEIGAEFAGTPDSPVGELRVIEDVDGTKFVNVDTTNAEGIQHAADLELARSGLVDVMSTPYVYHAGRLFDRDHRGRLFTLLRHPVERAVSMYYYLKSTPGGRNMLNGMDLEHYAKSDLVENNWMVRFLSNQLGGELTPENEALAREVLRRKFLVGLLSEKGRSLDRFESYFGWKIRGERMEHCHEKLLDWSWPNKHKHPGVKEGGKVWNLLEEQNSFDIRLYGYAQELFKLQGVFFKPDDVEREEDW